MSNHSGKLVATKDNLCAIQCDVCCFKHLDPIPDTSIYPSGIYHSTMKPTMRDDYERDLAWHQAIHRDWLVLCESHLPNHRLLDVGCGTGHFLNSAQTFGLDARGVEPDYDLAHSDPRVAWCEYADYSGTDYGILSAHWVMEHLADPTHFLQWCYKRLATNGVLLITIPNDFSSMQFRAMEKINRPYYWLDKTHINYWSDDFTSFLWKNGFRCFDAYGSWQPEQYLMDGLNYLDDPTLGCQLHQQRIAHDLETGDKYRRAKYQLWGWHSWGRDISYMAVKV